MSEAINKPLLTVGEQIDRNRDGRSQKSIVAKMNAAGCEITEVQFSNRKNGHEKFSEVELKTLSEILETDLTAYAE